MAEERKHRLMIAVDEAKLEVEGLEAYVWAAVDAETKELLVLSALYRKPSLNAYIFLKKALM